MKPPTAQAIAIAKLHPLGWVMAVDHYDGPPDRVPVERIVGMWKVNSEGEITGEFVSNPRYVPVEDCN